MIKRAAQVSSTLGENMKRDMDVIRAIVLEVRSSDSPVSRVDGIESDVFSTHAQLLEEAGLVHAAIQGDKRAARAAVIFRLSWAGHDFADSIIDDTIWNKAKDNVIKPAASWSFGILLEYLKLEIKRNVPGLD
jgi:hypothetical protein